MFAQGLRNIITHLNYYDFYVGYKFQAQLKQFEQMMPIFFICYPAFSTFTSLQEQYMTDIFVIFKEFFHEVLTSHYFIDILIGGLNICLLLSLILVIVNTFKHKIIISKASQQHIKCMNISFFYIQLQYILICLVQPLYCIVYYNIENAFQQQSQIRLTNLSMSFLLVILYQIIHHVFLNSDFLLSTKQHRRINDSLAVIFYQILLFLQPIAFTFFTKEQAYPLQIVIIILVIIINSVKIWHTKLYQHNRQIQMIFVFVSINISIIIQILFNLNKFLMLLVISPILYYIQKTLWKQHLQGLLLAQPQQLNENNLNFMLCFMFSENKIEILFQDKLNLFILVNQHMKKCPYVKCQCHKFNNLDVFTSSSKLLDCFREYFVSNIKSLNKQRRENFHLNCHYLSSLDLLGKHNEILIETNLQAAASFESWTIIEQIKFTSLSTYLKQQQYNRLLEKIVGDNYKDNLLEINDYLQTESKIAQIRIQLIRLIQIKIDYINLINVKDGNEQFNLILKFAKYKFKIETFLNLLYSSFSGVKIKSILMFYYAEIINDWFRAYDYKMTQNNDQFFEFKLQSLQVCYLVCSYNQTNLILENYSKQAVKFFNQENLLQKSNPIMIIPKAIKETHQQYIDNFLETGKSKYFQKKEINLYEAKQGILTPCIFFQDIFYDDMNQFKFLTFYEQQESTSLIGYIIIDKDNNINGISQDFISMLNKDLSYLEDEIVNILNYMPFDIFFKRINNQCMLTIPKSKYCQQIISKSYHQKMRLLQQQDFSRIFELNCQFNQRETFIIIKVFSLNEVEESQQLVSTQIQQSYIDAYQENDQVILPYSDEEGIQDNVLQTRLHLTQLSPRIDSIQLTNRNQLIIDKANSQNDTLDQRSEKNIKDDEIQTIKILGDVYAYDYDRQSGIINEQQSCASSLAGIKRSKYFQKYYLYHRFINNNQYGRYKNLIIIVCLLFIVVQILFGILSLNFVIKDFKDMEQYYKIVQVNHYFIEPLQKFFLTRYTSVANSLLFRQGQITSERLAFLNSFNKPNLQQQYLDFKQNYHENFDDPSLKEFINDKYLNISFKKGEFAPKIYLEYYNITLAMAFSELTETFYRGYLHYTTQPDPYFTSSAGFVFQYSNYMEFVNIFEQVSNEVTLYSQYRTQQDTIKWKILAAMTSTCTFIILFLFYHYSFKLKKQCETLLNLSSMIDVDQIYIDLKRYQFLIQSLNSNTSDLIQRYQFNLDEKEIIVQKYNQLNPSIKKINKQDQSLQKRQKLYISRKWSFILIVICSLYTSCFLTSITVSHTSHLDKFPSTIQLLKQSSDLGVFLPAIFSYMWIIQLFFNIPFLTSNQKQEFIDQTQLGANSIDSFQQIIFKQKDYQFSHDKLIEIQQSAQSDICPQLNASNYVNFDYFCSNSYSGLLKRGLNLALAQYKQDTDMALTSNFTQIPNNRQLEMESVYLASAQLSKLVSQIISEINNENQSKKSLLIVLISILLVLSIVSFYFVYASQFNIESKIQASKFVIWMLPQTMLFLNDNFEREVRMIGFKEDML